MTVVRIARSALFLALAACADSGSTGATGGTIVLTAPGSWTPSPPPLIIDLIGRTVGDLVYDRLAEIGPRLNVIGDTEFEPRLARRWTWAPDSLSIAFEIDPRARWHDGKPVRAVDVQFTFGLVKDPRTGSSITAVIDNIDSVTTRDSLTAVVWYHRRTPQQFYDFVYQVHIMPEHVWKDVPRDKLATAEQGKSPIGTGRFRFGKFEPGVRLELIADTANFRGRAKLDRVVWQFASDAGATVTSLLTGQADMLELVPPPVLPRVDSSATLRVLKYQNLFFTYLGFNLRDPKRPAAPHPVLGDARVRRALSMALDRQALLSNVFGAHGVIGAGPLPSALLGGDSLSLLKFDRQRASALLDSAGWAQSPDGVRRRAGKPLTFALLVPTSSALRMRFAVLIQEQLKSVGANVTIESMEFTPYNDRQVARQFDAAMMTLGFDPSPMPTVKQAWSSAGIGKSGQNFVSYSSPKFDATIDSALASFDPARANTLFRRALQTVVDDAPGVWLYDVPALAGLHKRVQPVGMRGDGWWVNLADWWVPANERIDRDRIGLRTATP
jgi:peptide/nickel transport system substrate-binding protein